MGSESEWAPIWGEGEAGCAYMASPDPSSCGLQKGQKGDVVTGWLHLLAGRSWVGLKSDSSMTLHPASRDSVHHCTSLSDPNKRQLRGHVGVTTVK